jgi:Zn-dependent oligopeptidase
MAKTPEKVYQMFDELEKETKVFAEKEHSEIQKIAAIQVFRKN